jgi:flagellar hook protein FlgE
MRNNRLKSGLHLADSEDMDASAIALQGLQQAEFQLDAAANAIAGGGTDSSNAGNVDVVDLSAEMVALMSAQTQYEANLATLKTADQIEQNLVNLTG